MWRMEFAQRKSPVMSSDSTQIPPEEESQRRREDAPQAGSFIDETAEGFPICQWCGGAITSKAELVVAADETGAPAQIAPVGYTAPRTFAAFHRDCHAEFAEEPPSREEPDTTEFWTPVNVAIIVATVLLVLVVLFFAILPP